MDATTHTQETLNRFIEFEGKVNHFYLDGPGNVTIGIGCLIKDTLSAKFLNMYFDGVTEKAKPVDIVDEYLRIKQAEPNHSSAYYKTLCKLILPESEIIRLFEFRLENMLNILSLNMPTFKTLPIKAADVVSDMAYNLGVSGLMTKFPKFIKAIELCDWKEAAKECRRRGISESRNSWAFNTLMEI